MNTCRLCHAHQLDVVIPLGNLPLANALRQTKETPSPRYSLNVLLCASCGLAQLQETIPPTDLFSHYVYFSSHSQTMQASCKTLIDRITQTLNPQKSFIVEVASNDGYLLKHYLHKGFSVLGIDPAQNIAQKANDNGISTLCDFFNKDCAKKIHPQKADVIHANNVLAHVPDLHDFVEGFKTLLNKGGTLIVEVPYLLDLVKNLEFDTIYHEHVFYFSLKPLIKLFSDHGLCIFDVEKISIHGGSLRLFIGHDDERSQASKINSFLHAEQTLLDLKTYKIFMDQIHQLKTDLHHLLNALLEKNAKISAYGASAKGATLLNFFEIDADKITFVVDKNPIKQGLWMPGKNIPIYDTEKLLQSDYALLLSWNFKEEIAKQQQNFLNNKKQFILPLPRVCFYS
ncbi:MAG: hypothetical protein NEHIOOID_00057 [Holosporales bacterium]